jgi:hypothetical protein
VFTLNNRFFCHQACYSLLPAKPGGQADRVISLGKYKVVGFSCLPVHRKPRENYVKVQSHNTRRENQILLRHSTSPKMLN